jgi:hypothetical protein
MNSLLPPTTLVPLLTLVSEGNPLLLLLIGSKAVTAPVFVPDHIAPPLRQRRVESINAPQVGHPDQCPTRLGTAPGSMTEEHVIDP